MTPGLSLRAKRAYPLGGLGAHLRRANKYKCYGTQIQQPQNKICSVSALFTIQPVMSFHTPTDYIFDHIRGCFGGESRMFKRVVAIFKPGQQQPPRALLESCLAREFRRLKPYSDGQK